MNVDKSYGYLVFFCSNHSDEVVGGVLVTQKGPFYRMKVNWAFSDSLLYSGLSRNTYSPNCTSEA